MVALPVPRSTVPRPVSNVLVVALSVATHHPMDAAFDSVGQIWKSVWRQTPQPRHNQGAQERRVPLQGCHIDQKPVIPLVKVSVIENPKQKNKID